MSALERRLAKLEEVANIAIGHQPIVRIERRIVSPDGSGEPEVIVRWLAESERGPQL